MLWVQMQRSFQGGQGIHKEAAGKAGLGLNLQEAELQPWAGLGVCGGQGCFASLHTILVPFCRHEGGRYDGLLQCLGWANEPVTGRLLAC